MQSVDTPVPDPTSSATSRPDLIIGYDYASQPSLEPLIRQSPERFSPWTQKQCASALTRGPWDLSKLQYSIVQ